MFSRVERMRRVRSRLALASLTALAAVVLTVSAAAPAYALDPSSAVGGAGSKWFSGSLMMSSGMNCSTAILGEPYSETMVSAIGGYGGAPNGGVVRVGDRYYASLLVSIPGWPCGTGTSVVATDVALPRNTAYDPSAPIRCFGKPRNANDWVELTGGTWSMPAEWGGGSGPYCPTTVSPISATGAPGAVGVGYRPLTNGQMFQLFVPIKSTTTLEGAAHSPADELHWVLRTTGTYALDNVTSTWVNVFPSGAGSSPSIYFARNPSVVPFWKKDAPAGQENRVEFFANLYSAGQTGTFCWELHSGTSGAGPLQFSCTSPGMSWSGNIDTSSDMWQVFGTGDFGGPNGGYVPPLLFDPGEVATMRWTFQPTSGPLVYKDVTFTALSGPDNDGDGVADAQDACPTVAGTEGNGCQPGVQSDTDGDGVFGDNDKCPGENGGTGLDGCPVAGSKINGAIGAIKGNKIARRKLAKGVKVAVTCKINSRTKGVLTITAKTAKKLKIKVKRRQKTVTIGSGVADCAGTQGGSLKLKLKSTFKKALLKSRKSIPAVLTVSFSRDGSTTEMTSVKLKLT